MNEYVEDLFFHSEILANRGYEVRACESYAEGEAWIEQEDFDLVIVSQGTPAFEGSSVLMSATARDRTAPVLVLTHNANMKCYLEAMQLGAVDYVEVPLAPSEITRLVEWHLRPGYREA